MHHLSEDITAKDSLPAAKVNCQGCGGTNDASRSSCLWCGKALLPVAHAQQSASTPPLPSGGNKGGVSRDPSDGGRFRAGLLSPEMLVETAASDQRSSHDQSEHDAGSRQLAEVRCPGCMSFQPAAKTCIYCKASMEEATIVAPSVRFRDTGMLSSGALPTALPPPLPSSYAGRGTGVLTSSLGSRASLPPVSSPSATAPLMRSAPGPGNGLRGLTASRNTDTQGLSNRNARGAQATYGNASTGTSILLPPLPSPEQGATSQVAIETVPPNLASVHIPSPASANAKRRTRVPKRVLLSLALAVSLIVFLGSVALKAMPNTDTLQVAAVPSDRTSTPMALAASTSQPRSAAISSAVPRITDIPATIAIGSASGAPTAASTPPYRQGAVVPAPTLVPQVVAPSDDPSYVSNQSGISASINGRVVRLSTRPTYEGRLALWIAAYNGAITQLRQLGAQPDLGSATWRSMIREALSVLHEATRGVRDTGQSAAITAGYEDVQTRMISATHYIDVATTGFETALKAADPAPIGQALSDLDLGTQELTAAQSAMQVLATQRR